MYDLACLHIHPDDQPPIQRTCRRNPRHDGPHRMLPDHSHYTGPVDEWEADE
jgi:hypothetical protein